MIQYCIVQYEPEIAIGVNDFAAVATTPDALALLRSIARLLQLLAGGRVQVQVHPHVAQVVRDPEGVREHLAEARPAARRAERRRGPHDGDQVRYRLVVVFALASLSLACLPRTLAHREHRARHDVGLHRLQRLPAGSGRFGDVAPEAGERVKVVKCSEKRRRRLSRWAAGCWSAGASGGQVVGSGSGQVTITSGRPSTLSDGSVTVDGRNIERRRRRLTWSDHRLDCCGQ